MKLYFSIILALVISMVTSCNHYFPSRTEKLLVGTWVSDSDSTVFVFFSDGTFLIEDPTLGRTTGTYSALDRQSGLRENRIILEGARFNIDFLSTEEAFVINYGDGITSSAIFRRKEE